MRHVGQADLDQLEPLLASLRSVPGLVEKKRGVFYRRSKAFLHFHADPAGLFADVRLSPGGDFERFRVTTVAERRVLLRRVQTSP